MQRTDLAASRSSLYGGGDLRSGRWSVVGAAYLITSTTFQRDEWFIDFWCARAVVRAMREVHDAGIVHSHAFVVMPDHVHWLFTLSHGRLCDAVRRFKSISAKAVNSRTHQGRSVWQRGYHDRCLRRGQHLRAAARYVVANPLRAGLVTRLNDYPHWDAEYL